MSNLLPHRTENLKDASKIPVEIWRGLLPGLHSNPKVLETQRQEQIIVWTCFISTCFLLIARGAKLSSDAKKRPHSIVSYCCLRLVLYYVQLIFYFSPFSIVVHFDLLVRFYGFWPQATMIGSSMRRELGQSLSWLGQRRHLVKK